MTPRLIFGLLACAAFVGSAPSTPDGDDAYRKFTRSRQGSTLLAEARDAMSRHWGSASAARPAEIPWPAAPRGIYLSLTDGNGTRACVGNALPYRGGLVETVRALAVQSLQADRRRAPIRSDELQSLRIVISFAGAVEPIADPMQVDPGRDGLLISSTGGSVAFLPGEARTVAWALREARRIGVLQGPPEGARYSRFPVVVLAEPTPKPSHVEDSDDSP